MNQIKIPSETLEILLNHKKDVLENISTHYKEELNDANVDSEKLFKYGFIFTGVVEGVVGGLTVVIKQSAGSILFTSALLLLTLGISSFLYERIRIEKSSLRQHANAEREPIMQQIAMLKGFLEPNTINNPQRDESN